MRPFVGTKSTNTTLNPLRISSCRCADCWPPAPRRRPRRPSACVRSGGNKNAQSGKANGSSTSTLHMPGADGLYARAGITDTKAALLVVIAALRDGRKVVLKAHRLHLRASNVVESPFSAGRPRTAVAKRYNKVAHAEALIQEILPIVEKTFRCLNAPSVLEAVYAGTKFADGVAVKVTQRRLAA